MHEAMLAGKGKEALESLLAEVFDYTRYHFSHEEQLMQRIDYPNLDEHRREHEGLRANVEALRNRLAAGEVTMTIEVTLFLIDWLKKHTIASDRCIGEHLKGHGNRLG
jgi:hemerythrin